MSSDLHPRILELLVSRVCHDLVSPVGAVSNGLELMDDGEDSDKEALALVASSAEQASVRLKLFRLCYGAAGTDRNLDWKEVRESFLDWMKTAPRITINWPENLSEKLSEPPRGFMKSLLNVLILAEESSHGAGEILVDASAEGAEVVISGPQAGLREGVEDILTGAVDPESLDPRSVHACVTGHFVRYFGFSLETKKTEGKLSLSLKI